MTNGKVKLLPSFFFFPQRVGDTIYFQPKVGSRANQSRLSRRLGHIGIESGSRRKQQQCKWNGTGWVAGTQASGWQPQQQCRSRCCWCAAYTCCWATTKGAGSLYIPRAESRLQQPATTTERRMRRKSAAVQMNCSCWRPVVQHLITQQSWLYQTGGGVAEGADCGLYPAAYVLLRLHTATTTTTFSRTPSLWLLINNTTSTWLHTTITT